MLPAAPGSARGAAPQQQNGFTFGFGAQFDPNAEIIANAPETQQQTQQPQPQHPGINPGQLTQASPFVFPPQAYAQHLEHLGLSNASPTDVERARIEYQAGAAEVLLFVFKNG